MDKSNIRMKLVGFVSAVGLLASSCANEPANNSGTTGQIKAFFKANYSVKAVGAAEDSGDGSVTNPEIADFMVHLKKVDGSFDKTWSSIREFPTDAKYSVGAYQMDISYGSMDEEGFEKPYYYGTEKFNVVDDETVSPEITATLANTMVSVTYTDAFKQYFTDYSTRIHSEGGDYITFTKDEVRPAYVKPGKVSMEMTLTKTNGTTFSFNPADIENALPRTHYKVKFDVNGGEVGKAVLSITFDDQTTVQPISIALGDELLNAPAPTLKPNGYDNNTPVNIIECDDAPGKINCVVSALSGLKSVILTTESEYLKSKGWPAEIDLMQATEEQKTLFTSMGLNVAGLWKNPETMALIDFTKLVSNLRPLNGNSTHKFILQVKDVFTRVCDTPVTLTVNAPAVVFNLSNPVASEIGTTVGEFTATFNGANFEKNVKFKAFSDYGVWVDASVLSINKVSDNTYKVKVTIPNNVSSVRVKGDYKNGVSTTEELVLPRTLPQITLSSNPVDIWATKATLTMSTQSSDALSVLLPVATLYVKNSDGTYVKASNVTKDTDKATFTITGLTAGTTYNVKVSCDNGATFSGEYSFTTEAAQQVQNANMENWYNVMCYNGKVAWVGTDCYEWFAKGSASEANYWGTRNPMTTSQRNGAACYYTCCSGTVSTTGRSGNAAEISTLGWGEGNTYTQSLVGVVIKNKTPGMLFMGDYSYDGSETFTYGRPFTSRPASFEFYYKYAPMSGESFSAYMVVENREGGKTTEIARGELVSGNEVGSFTKATVKLNYSRTDLKATHAYIVFTSSTSDSPEVKCVNGSKIAWYGYSDSRYMGSILTVDDINIVY